MLISFFRARRGAARGFRLTDPFDYSSNGMAGQPTANDQVIGTGDGQTATFQLVKHYGGGDEPQTRLITRPHGDSVRVSVDGVETSAFSLLSQGKVALAAAPRAGAMVSAGFIFDVPVRFAEDRLDITARYSQPVKHLRFR